MLNWKCTKRDFDTIVEIAERAVLMNRRHGSPQLMERRDFIMDVQATHCNGCRLALNELLVANEEDFAHDIYGIVRHIDRQTGQLGDCFSPRYAAVYHR